MKSIFSSLSHVVPLLTVACGYSGICSVYICDYIYPIKLATIRYSQNEETCAFDELLDINDLN